MALKSLLPNALTVSRCMFAVCVFLGAWFGVEAGLNLTGLSGEAYAEQAARQQLWFQFALLGFVSGTLTDFLDGFFARLLKAETRFGVWLDPIADKLLVGAALLGLCLIYRTWLIIIPAALIIARDIFMTWFRTTDAGKAAIEPSAAAKLKTAMEMGAIITLMLPLALWPAVKSSGETTLFLRLLNAVFVLSLWGAAALSWTTAADYLRSKPK